jgi:hypothetical protein
VLQKPAEDDLVVIVERKKGGLVGSRRRLPCTAGGNRDRWR